jgi:hypothetical protein
MALVRPLLYTTKEFIKLYTARGFIFNEEVRKFLILENSSGGKVLEDILKPIDCRFMRRLSSIFHNLKYLNINTENITTLFFCLSPRHVKNLYRYYYLEWLELQSKHNVPKICWRYTPSQFNRLQGDELKNSWLEVLERFINEESTNSSFVHCFLINRFYRYLIPFS